MVQNVAVSFFKEKSIPLVHICASVDLFLSREIEM